MRRAAALRLVGGLFGTTALAACGKLACNQYPVPLANGTTSTPTTFGSQIYESDDLDRALTLLGGCGGTYVRIELNGNPDFSDAVFAAAAQRNMRVVLLSPRMTQPVDLQSYAQTCAALAQRYVKYNPVWEIWNEPNLAIYWLGVPNVDDYSRLAIATGKALRAAGVQDIWSGGTSGLDVPWIERMKANGVFEVMNGAGIHSYNPACEAFNEYLALKARVPGVQFHTTETCIPSTADQSGFLRQMWYVHRIAGIPTMIWCELRDGTAGTSGPYAFPYGLLRANYTPKESYFVAQSLVARSKSLSS
jgi:hypothetical protein